MKKTIALISVMAMLCALLTGCFSNPVADELDKFINVEMATPNKNYEAVKADFEKLKASKDDAEARTYAKSMSDTLAQSIAIAEKIQLETDEVKDARDKYLKSMKTEKEAMDDFCKAVDNGSNQAECQAATDKLNEGVKLLDEYNKALEAIAKDNGMEIKY